MPALRNAEAGAYVIANPLPAAVRLNAGENVETGFEPICEALCDFECLVLGMIGGQYTVKNGLGSFHSEVGVQFDHGVAGRDGVIAIDLDFVVFLGRGKSTKSNDNYEGQDSSHGERFECLSSQNGTFFSIRNSQSELISSRECPKIKTHAC